MKRHFNRLRPTAIWVAILMMLITVGCSRAYYGAMEKVGVHKRDIMVDRVESARDAQQDAKELPSGDSISGDKKMSQEQNKKRKKI